MGTWFLHNRVILEDEKGRILIYIGLVGMVVAFCSSSKAVGALSG
jgi:hypothetical protein